jgi:diadenosine tetraphosphate (Ap4A) HIT family hydrolase
MARNGNNEKVICRLKSGWVVMGDSQFFLGYCLLLSDPVVRNINELDIPLRMQFLIDMTLIGDAILTCTNADKINYEILGNSDDALHAHIFPRRNTEDEIMRVRPIWMYDKKLRDSIKFDSSIHAEIISDIKRYLSNNSNACSPTR